MELSTLRFVVDTKQLDAAAKSIAALGVEVGKLNKPMQALNKETAQSAKELSKAEEAAAKAALAQSKLEQAQSKGTQAASKSISVLERQNLILEYMAQGNSKGQASILATAKAAGALDADMLSLNQTLKTQRTLIGGDPFDKSIGLMQKLQNEYKTTLEVTTLFNRNLGLTEKQMVDLAREKERLIALYGIEGKDIKQLAGEYDNLIRRSVEINRTNDARTNSMKAQIKAQNDTAKANEYIAKELERVNRLTESNGDITSATNNRLIRFEKELKASGITAAEVTTRLDAYRTSLLATQKAAGNRQVDYLSRALGPQITDIFVGLATGQSPMTILLQQGGQLRDQFALAGVAGSEMGKMLVQASKAMVVSVKDIGLAVGQLITGAFVGAGKAVTNFGMQITGTGPLLAIMRSNIVSMVGENSMLVKTFDAAGKAITLFTGVAVVSGITALATLAVAMSDVIKEENTLNRALNLTGAALGLSLDMAYDAARGMEQFGVNTGTALTVLTEMAKVGGMSSDSFKMVATTAKAMKTAFDIPIAETVKQFKELQEKPTESLTKLAIKLGTIPLEILKQVDAYERAGKTIKAAEIATKAYADAGKDAADRTVENFGTITRLGISLGKIWSSTWDAIMGFGRRDTLGDQLKEAEKNLAAIQGMRGADVVGSRTNQRVLASMKLVDDLKNQIAAEKELEQQKAKSSEAASKFEDDKKKRDEAANKLKADAKKLEESYNSELDKAKETYLAQIGALDHLTKSEITLQKIKASTNWNAYTQQQRDYITSLYEATIVNEKAVKSEKERADAIEKLMQVQKKADDALFDSLDAEHALNMQVLEQTQLLELQSSLIKSTDEQRKKALASKRLDLKLEEEIAAIKKRAIPEAEQNDQINRARQRRIDNEKNLNTEIAIDAATKTLEEYNKIADGITDSIVTALIEGGEAGGKKLRSIIEAELKRPITVFVRAIVDSLTGGAGSAAGSAGGNLLSSMGGSLISSTLGSITVGGGSLAAAGSAFGTGFMTTLQGGSIAEAAGIYSAAGMTGVSGGLSAGAAVAGAIPQIAAALAVANALGLFRSTKQVGGGISGTLGGSVDQYGLIRKSGTLFNGPSYFRQNQGTFAGNDLLQTSFQQLKDSTKAMADTLKLSSAGVEDFTKTIDISFDGLTNTQIEEKIASTLKSVNDELAALVLGAGATADQLNTLYNNVMQQRYDLETQLLELQGKTLELRERERAKIYDVNKEMFDQIKALEDQKVANEQAAAAMEKLTSVTTTIVDEINRLLGVSTSSSGLEAQFAILTAQARSGDLAALAQLPDVTKGLEQIAASSAVNATDIIVARARLAQSLQDTLGYFPSGTSLSTSSTSVSASNALSSGLTVSSGTSVNSASSNQELLAALVTEVQGLRAEVRADVSHNAKTAKILERVNQDGESLSITTLV
jgi:phage-related minor tail protein